MNKTFPFIIQLLLFFILTTTFFGCGIWEDFTTYFNLYYNTKDKFEQAENAVKLQRKNLFEYDEKSLTGNVPQQFNAVIEKCSKILQFHSSSSYVDNALLMLGKSFYYQKNYLKALRKFQELQVTYPESDLILDNELWIGKTDMRLKNFDLALNELKVVRDKAIEEDEYEIIKDAYAEEIVYRVRSENYQSAISLISEFLNVSDDDEVNAEVEFELGKLYRKVDDLDNAILSFKRVFDYSPAFEVELNTQLELATALRETDKAEEASAILEKLKSETKYSDAYDRIDLETGVTLYDLGIIDESVSKLILVDTTYSNSMSASIARYKLGEIFEYHFKNFDSASYYYTKSISAAASPDYIKQAAAKSELFKKYQSLRKSILDTQKQLRYLENPEYFVQDSIAFYSDTLATDENLSNEQINQNKSLDELKDRQNVNRTPKANLKNPPVRPTISIDSAKALMVKNEFDLANLFFNELSVPDSAYFYYNDIVNNYPNSRYHSRALYSIGTYYSSIDQKTEADSIFNFIYENYQNDKIVNSAAIQLNKPQINFNYDEAEDLYKEAESKYLDKKYREALNKFYNIYKKHPASPFAPKALYAGGWILESELKLLDSAAVLYDSINTKYPQTKYASDVRPKLTFYKEEINRKKKAIADSLKQIEIQKDNKLKADSLNNVKKQNRKLPADSLEINKKIEQNITTDSSQNFKKSIKETDNDLIPEETDSSFKKEDIPLDLKEKDRQKIDRK